VDSDSLRLAQSITVSFHDDVTNHCHNCIQHNTIYQTAHDKVMRPVVSVLQALRDLNIVLPTQEHSVDEIVDHIMKQADQNQDGKIYLKDFMNASITSNTLASLLQSTIKAADSPYLRRKVCRSLKFTFRLNCWILLKLHKLLGLICKGGVISNFTMPN